ncbi:MAG: phosphate signaling complex protein PhoU [Pseudomonadales bacterium]
MNNPHISEQYDAELAAARNLLMEMGGLVEQQLHDAAQALINQDEQLATKVRTGDVEVNRLEVEIDERCIHIIARRQPAASDLRTLVSIMKASTDLERIGDEAGRIAKMAQALSQLEYPGDQYADFRVLSARAEEIVANSLDAFARLDPDGAMQVIESDEHIDQGYNALVRDRSSNMRADATSIDRDMNVIWAARALERIGDHAKNISEYVVYLVKGQDVRHADKLRRRQGPAD